MSDDCEPISRKPAARLTIEEKLASGGIPDPARRIHALERTLRDDHLCGSKSRALKTHKNWPQDCDRGARRPRMARPHARSCRDGRQASRPSWRTAPRAAE